jgi:hypothetical protein
MALTDEQRTMLQLLLEGQSYEDIGGLLGSPPEEIRSRAQEAVAAIAGPESSALAELTDFLLGKADPIGRADAVRQLQGDPAANESARRLVSQLRLIAPRASLPEIPPARASRHAPASPPAVPPPTGAGEAPHAAPAPLAQPAGRASEGLVDRLGGTAGRVRSNPRLAIGLGGVALLLAVVVLAIVVFNGDNGSGSGTTSASSGDLTVVPLGPLEPSSGASGQAVFAGTGSQPVLQINLSGLQPTGKGESYIVWLYNTPKVAYPLARDTVGSDGNLTGRTAIPTAVDSLLPQFGCIDVSLAPNKETEKALAAAVGKRTLPHHAGASVLRGQIPRNGQQAGTGAGSDCTAAAASGGASTAPTSTGP